jgi:hypothetical protein
MIYSPHTFEITLNLDTNKFLELKNKAYYKAKKKNPLYLINNIYYDHALKDHGIRIYYHDCNYKKKIKFIVNPTTMLGGNDIIKLWKPNVDYISKLLRKLNKHIEDYFDSKYCLNDFKLTRIDFTVNIDVGDKENVYAYIKALHNIGKVKGFAPKYGKYDDRIDPDRSFDLEGNSNGVEFAAYDKEAQSEQKEAKGILRIEVRLTKSKAIRKYIKETVTSKQFKSLALNSKDVFLETFVNIVPFGDFFKKEEAVRLIEEEIPKKKHREKMLRLIELIPVKKSLYLAQKEMNDRNIDKIMDMFGKLYLSPVTISKRQKIKTLKNLYCYLLDD